MIIFFAKVLCAIAAFYLGRHIARLQLVSRCNTGSTVANSAASTSTVSTTGSATALTTSKCPPSHAVTTTTASVDDAGIEGQCHAAAGFVNVSLQLSLIPATVVTDVFPLIHHPSSPAKWAVLFTPSDTASSTYRRKGVTYTNTCTDLYLTRTGQRASQPNKCVAVVKLDAQHPVSMVQQSHRWGVTALTLDQYQKDFPRGKSYDEERTLLPPLIGQLDTLLAEFKRKMGEAVDPVTGHRRTVTVMVVNEGVMDLLLNFICSAEGIGFDLSTVMVFIGDKSFADLIESMGAKAMYSPALGSMPPDAAGGYLDHIFMRLMWFKVTSVYLALNSGFHVLFQDVDLVWLKNPIPFFEKEVKGDVSFMDDGARTPRYTPFFVNSGFYYVKNNPRTMFFMENMMKSGPSDIGFSHSHQSVLIRHISEAHHLYGMEVEVLDMALFPSGQTYHENKKLLNKIIKRDFRPYVFHMCWTDNRVNKVVYFKEIGLWYVPDDNSCSQGKDMLRNAYGAAATKQNIRDKCCMRQKYWPKEEVTK